MMTYKTMAIVLLRSLEKLVEQPCCKPCREEAQKMLQRVKTEMAKAGVEEE